MPMRIVFFAAFLLQAAGIGLFVWGRSRAGRKALAGIIFYAGCASALYAALDERHFLLAAAEAFAAALVWTGFVREGSGPDTGPGDRRGPA